MSQVLSVQKVGFQIPVYTNKEQKLLANPASLLLNFYKSSTKRETVSLLKDINLELGNGDRLAILGRNGAGKSTLLRVLAGIYEPTEGVIRCKGSIGGLFEITLGFNQNATGIENIFLRGAQMGLKIKEIKDNIPYISEFTELGDKLYQPINTYSTGMKLRLAFCVSTLVIPDVLLLDEWIGSGDDKFRDKIVAKMDEAVETASCLVLATHSINLIKKICNKAIVMDKGSIVFQGDIDAATAHYKTI